MAVLVVVTPFQAASSVTTAPTGITAPSAMARVRFSVVESLSGAHAIAVC